MTIRQTCVYSHICAPAVTFIGFISSVARKKIIISIYMLHIKSLGKKEQREKKANKRNTHKNVAVFSAAELSARRPRAFM